MDNELAPERTTHAVKEDVKRLVQVTAIWVALREGFSLYFKYNGNITSNKGSHQRARSASLTPKPKRPAITSPTICTPESGYSAFAAVVKLRHTRPSGPGSIALGPPSPQVEAVKAPQRSTSAGTAFMQRVVARRGRRPQSTSAIANSDGESVRWPTRRSMTEHGSYTMPPPSLAFPTSSATTLDSPTRQLQRYMHSAYILSHLLTCEAAVPPSGEQAHVVSEEDLDLEWVVKPKASRWKMFTNFFRRSQTGSS
jgi:hypothetical protein